MSFNQYLTQRRNYLESKISELEHQIGRVRFSDLYELGRLQGQILAYEDALANMSEGEDIN